MKPVKFQVRFQSSDNATAARKRPSGEWGQLSAGPAQGDGTDSVFFLFCFSCALGATGAESKAATG